MNTLPSDTEIEQHIDTLSTPEGADQYTHCEAFMQGALWMREKIAQTLVTKERNQSELLSAFIKAIKEEFKDDNWDYLDFIADRVRDQDFPKYSKQPFDNYTHRFIVEFDTDKGTHDMDIYSNCSSYDKFNDFINKKASDKVKSFQITYVATKEDDDMTTMLIDELMQ